jgi:hypothetical protein
MPPVGFASAYDPLQDSGLNQLYADLSIMVTATLAKAVTEATAVESEVLSFLGQTINGAKLVETFAAEFTQAHRDVGNAALRSLIDGYTHRRFRRPQDPYRAGDQRYAGGALLRALRREEHVNAFARGFDFLDTGILNSEAKQWRRLNFGAGSGSAGGIDVPQSFQMTWGDLVVGLRPDPRPAFRIPRGFWFDQGGTRVGAGADRSGRFYYVGSPELPASNETGNRRLGRPSPGRVTRGIASANFLDAGIRRIANELPRAYNTLFNDLYDRQLGKLEEVGATAGLRAPSPNAGEVTLIRRFHRGTRYR